MTMTSHVLQDAIKAHEGFITAQPEEFRFVLPLLRLLASGKPVELRQLATVVHRPLEEIQAVLQSSDAEVDQAGNIVGWDLSLVPTPHRFHLGENILYTWCALDALVFPALIGRTAHVVSTCPATGKTVSLNVTPTHIEHLEPASAAVSVRAPGAEADLCNIRAGFCMQGHFFAVHEAAVAWPALHPQAVLLSVEEAAELGRELVRRILAFEQESDNHEYSI
jgi:alkylmercury lyase